MSKIIETFVLFCYTIFSESAEISMKGDYKVEKKEIIQKLKALSERGIAGEKENATKLLEKLMKKYGKANQQKL